MTASSFSLLLVAAAECSRNVERAHKRPRYCTGAKGFTLYPMSFCESFVTSVACSCVVDGRLKRPNTSTASSTYHTCLMASERDSGSIPVKSDSIAVRKCGSALRKVMGKVHVVINRCMCHDNCQKSSNRKLSLVRTGLKPTTFSLLQSRLNVCLIWTYSRSAGLTQVL